MRDLIGAIVVALCLAWSASAQSQQPSPNAGIAKSNPPQNKATHSAQPNKTDQRGTEETPVIIKISPAQKSETETAEDAKERQEKAELDRKLVDFNRDLAYYTKVLAWVAGLQFLALVGQVIFLRLAFRESKRAADIARDAMVAGERAFVFATQVNSFWELDQGTGLYHWRFRPTWQNSGDTPTKIMTIHTECVLRDTPLPLGFNFNYPTNEIGTGGLIPPKITHMGGLVPRSAAISPQDILDVQAGRKYLYLWGWARYNDVFPGTPQHITRFCWSLVPVGDPRAYSPGSKPGDPGSLTFDFIYHAEGNCADDECTQ